MFHPNFVAMITRSRWPRNARPSNSSFVNGPYTSAVSNSVTPRSMARCTVAIDSCSFASP
jgi:hypothetical protein